MLQASFTTSAQALSELGLCKLKGETGYDIHPVRVVAHQTRLVA